MQRISLIRWIVSGFLAMAAMTAMAKVVPSAIVDAANRGDYSTAERLAIEATQEYPNSAKAWYLYAQVEDRMGHPKVALDALRRAEGLDPSSHFSNHPGYVTSLDAHLVQEVQHGTVLAQITPTPTPSKPFPWKIFGGIVAILIGLSVIVGLLWQRRRQAARETARKEALRHVADLQNRVMEIHNTLQFEQKTTSYLAQEADDLLTRINQDLTDLRTGSDQSMAESRLTDRTTLAAKVADLERRQRSGDYDAPTPPENFAAPSASPSIEDSRPSYASAPNPQYAPAPSMVIMPQSSSNGDFLTGMLIGEALSDRQDRVVEREVIEERTSPWTHEIDLDDRRSNDFSSDSSSSFDSGSGSDNFSSDSSSSSFDSGSGSDSF